ncbi:MAG: PAC2 family protein [Chloroflexota bacterium]|nr:PAC2 family protein [Chloroflexota bacterium]
MLHKQPELNKPVMIAGWPGIGNIGLIAVDTLRSQVQAEQFGEIEPWDFFYPKKATIKNGILQELEFPSNKFYYQRLANRDLLFFSGEEQPADSGRMYAEGRKAYQLADLVLDVAAKFGCQRVYTSGAAVSLIHHTQPPRVWAVASRSDLLQEVKSYRTVLMSEVEGRNGQGSITGLNGLLLGVAKKRGFEAVCLMGEIPDYLAGVPFPYPRASQAVLEVLTKLLGIEVNLGVLDVMTAQIDGVINDIYEKFPPEIKERIEPRRLAAQPKPETITEEEVQWMKEHIDELFKRGKGERPS